MKYILGIFSLIVSTYGNSKSFESFEAIIHEVNSGDAKWKAGENFDTDTPVSYIKGLLGAKISTDIVQLKESLQSIPNYKIPEEFDSRKQWPYCPTIRQIRDQGNCGSCWAVAAAAALSDRYCIATNGSFTMPLSDQQLLTCCTLCGDGCDGGFPYIAWKYFAFHGLVTGGGYESNVGCQPYGIQSCEHHSKGDLPNCKSLPSVKTPACFKNCSNPSYNSSYDIDSHKVHRAYGLRNDVAEIQKEILEHGPVEATFFVYSDFATYKSGVYHHITGKEMGGHAVKIIGWGVEDDTPYWMAANSWNTHWGDKGFFKILRGNDECGIETGVVAGIPKVN